MGISVGRDSWVFQTMMARRWWFSTGGAKRKHFPHTEDPPVPRFPELMNFSPLWAGHSITAIPLKMWVSFSFQKDWIQKFHIRKQTGTRRFLSRQWGFLFGTDLRIARVQRLWPEKLNDPSTPAIPRNYILQLLLHLINYIVTSPELHA